MRISVLRGETPGQKLSTSLCQFSHLVHLAQPIWTFTKNLKILKGRLPPEDSSDRRETLGKRVSDDFAKMIFRAEKTFQIWGAFFSKFSAD